MKTKKTPKKLTAKQWANAVKIPKIARKRGKANHYIDHDLMVIRAAFAIGVLPDSKRMKLKRKAAHFARCCKALRTQRKTT